jgi:Flp pilus assembly secretin CpaC
MVFGNGKQGELPLHKRIMSVFVLGIVLVLCAPAVKAYGEPVLAVSTDQMEDLSSLAVSKRLGIVVGCSRILPVDGVVRVAVADPNIVDVLVVSKTELIVNGKSLGRTTLYVWDSTGYLLSPGLPRCPRLPGSD